MSNFNKLYPHHQFEYPIKEYRVVDGDTVEVELDLGFRMYHKVFVRLMDIDAPEMKLEEHEAGKVAKQFVENWFAKYYDKGIICTAVKYDKYGGRIDGEFSVSEWTTPDSMLVHHLGRDLLENRLAVPYGEKFTPEHLKEIEARKLL